jgi:hypothetical protein
MGSLRRHRHTVIDGEYSTKPIEPAELLVVIATLVEGVRRRRRFDEELLGRGTAPSRAACEVRAATIHLAAKFLGRLQTLPGQRRPRPVVFDTMGGGARGLL